MSTTHTVSIRNGFANYINTQVGSGGYLDLTTVGGITLVLLSFSNPAFGSPVNGVISASGLPIEGTVIASGKLSRAYVKNLGGSIIFQGTVSTSLIGTGDIQVEDVYVSTGDIISLIQMDYITCP